MKNDHQTPKKKVLIEDFTEEHRELLPISIWTMKEVDAKRAHSAESSSFYRSEASYAIYFYKSISRTVIY